MNDDIGDRFKGYEAVFDFTLPRRLPMVIRVDGRAFHGLKLTKPFDGIFHSRMCAVAAALCKGIQGTVLAYFQSDEISIVARDDMNNTTEPWMGKRLSKILSLSAAIATATFNDNHSSEYKQCQFDSRAFVLPDLNEVTNYLIWRQQDATRNSVSMAAHAMFPHKSLHKVDSNGMIDRLRECGKPWEETPTHFKRGTICKPVKVMKPVLETGLMCERREWQFDYEVPIFTTDRGYIETLFLGDKNEKS
jgi:tRNA(His) 5'-end guanylyltransferase